MVKQYGVKNSTPSANLIRRAIKRRTELAKEYQFVSPVVPEGDPRPEIVETFIEPKVEVVADSPETGKYVVYVANKHTETGWHQAMTAEEDGTEAADTEEVIEKFALPGTPSNMLRPFGDGVYHKLVKPFSSWLVDRKVAREAHSP
ncbi:MAG: hypothetical protein ACRDF4_09610, partial [Rhabdochlamydiaceae bacterium]